MAKVTGIGGIFIKSHGKAEHLSAWYQENLGIKLETWGGGILRWSDDHGGDQGITVWHAADSDSDWFKPSNASFMVNYRVDDMQGMIDHLQANHVEIIKGPESFEHGEFMWIMDPDGNKIELWQPKPTTT